MRSQLGLPREQLVGLDAGDTLERAGFRVHAVPSAHEGLDTDQNGRHLYLGFVIEAEGRRLYHSGDSLAYPGLVERLGTDPFDVLFLPINGRDPARGVPGNMTAAEAVDLAAAVRPRFVVPHHYDMFTFNTVSVEEFAAEARRLPAGVRAAHSVVRRALGDHAVSITLGIDIGTSGTKTIAIDEKGTILASASAEYPCDHPRPGWSEQDPDLWWEATKQTVQQVMTSGRFQRGDVAGVGLSGQMHGSVFLDAAGEVIRPALLWNDQRTAAECHEIETKAGGREALIRLVANPALTGFTAPKLLWVRKHEPRNWERVRQVLLPKDYVRYRLTGTFATEVSDASGTLLARRGQSPLEPRAPGQARHRSRALARVS